MVVQKAKITFWGVRGSVAAPGKKTVRFGGNTACVEIESAGTRIICDAGTGIRPLGIDLMRRVKGRSINAHILISHLHWDHYMGLPFFKPLFQKKNSFVIGGPISGGLEFKDALSGAMKPPYFPIPISAMPADIDFKTIDENPFTIGDINVLPHLVNHPGGALGWRFEFENGRSLVHVTDNEPDGGVCDEKALKWMDGADILIHDAQYSPQNYKTHRGWGHSPYSYPLMLAKKAGIKKVFLFHFDPEDTDAHLSKVLKDAQKTLKTVGGALRCELACEGKSILL